LHYNTLSSLLVVPDGFTFGHIADIIDHFTTAVKLNSYVLYMGDYRCPVGFRWRLPIPSGSAAS
jgi:hypothetical protein